MNQSINQSIKFIQPFLQMIKSAHRAAVEKKQSILQHKLRKKTQFKIQKNINQRNEQ